jgi:hypothetical protein
MPLAIKLNPAKLDLVEGKEGKYALTSIAYVYLETRLLFMLPDSPVWPQAALQTLTLLAPTGFCPCGFILDDTRRRCDDFFCWSFAALAEKKY